MKNILLIIITIFLLILNISAEEMPKKSPWNFNSTLGFNFNDGNTDKTGGHFSLDLERISRINEFIFNLNGYYSETEKKKDTHKGDLTVKYDHNLFSKESFFIFIIPSYNEFQNLKFRLQGGAGWKHTFYKSTMADYSLSGAVLYETKKYLNIDKKDEMARVSVRSKLKYSFNESGRAYLTAFYQVNTGESEDYRLLAEFILEFNIYKNLFFEFKVNDEYNNLVLAGIEKNDLALINGIKLKL